MTPLGVGEDLLGWVGVILMALAFVLLCSAV